MLAEKDGNRPVSRQVQLDESVIRQWRKKKSKISELTKATGHSGKNSKRCRLSGGGRKPANVEGEEELADWIILKREQHLRVTCKMVAEKAKTLFGDTNPNFKASRGWLQKFFRRHNLSIRRRTTQCQKLPADSITKVVSFVKFNNTDYQV